MKERCQIKKAADDAMQEQWESYKVVSDAKFRKEGLVRRVKGEGPFNVRSYTRRVEENKNQNFYGEHADGTPTYPEDPTGAPALVGDLVRYVHADRFRQDDFEQRKGLVINHS